MKKRLVVAAALLITATALLPQSTARAGDVIDFLPEIQTARSFEIFWQILTTDNEVLEETCLDFPSASEFPDSMMVDINGALLSRDESFKLAIQAACVFSEIRRPELLDPVLSAESNFHEGLLEVLKGNSFTFSNGTVIEGSKQVFRMAAAFQLYGFLFGNPLVELLNPDESLSDCDVLSDLVMTGETLEMQYLALFNLAFVIGSDLMSELELEVSGPTNSICGEVSTAPLGELEAAAATGDVDAAVNLAGRQFGDVLIFVGDEPDITERDALEAQLAELELNILSNTMRFPLVALADATTIFLVELALSFIEGEFGG